MRRSGTLQHPHTEIHNFSHHIDAGKYIVLERRKAQGPLLLSIATSSPTRNI